MKVKVVKHNYRIDDFYYEVYSSKETNFWGHDIWISEITFFSSICFPNENIEERAIKYADDLFKPKKPIKNLKLDEIIYEKSI